MSSRIARRSSGLSAWPWAEAAFTQAIALAPRLGDLYVSRARSRVDSDPDGARRDLTLEYFRAVLRVARKRLGEQAWTETHAEAAASLGGSARWRKTDRLAFARAAEPVRAPGPVVPWMGGHIVCAAPLEKVVYVVVWVPGEPNSYGETATAAQVRQACHDFADVGEIVVDHRVHPPGWPDGLDAQVASADKGGVVVRRVYANQRLGWTAESVASWAAGQHVAAPILLDDGPIKPRMVENACAPCDVAEMHGQKLPRPLPRDTWYVAGQYDGWTEDDLRDITGGSLFGHWDVEPSADDGA